MCEGLAVMQHGSVVETMTVDQLRDNRPTHPYTKQLLRASRGYDRSALPQLEDSLS
jgi:peptide/nickel transport system ATP-binding protein